MQTRFQALVMKMNSRIIFTLIPSIVAVWGSGCTTTIPRQTTNNALHETGSQRLESSSKTTPLASGVTPVPKPHVDREKDVQIGYDIGYDFGVSAAKAGWSLPNSNGYSGVAKIHFPDSGAKDLEKFQLGLELGWREGFASIKSLPDQTGLRQLAWENLTPGKKLYDHNGLFEVTLVSSNRSKGTITVRYPSGSVEEKSFQALRTIWFTR